jgi:hypothetical protein
MLFLLLLESIDALYPSENVNYQPLKGLAFIARAGSLRAYAMHLIYQSYLALIFGAIDWTVHGGLLI